MTFRDRLRVLRWMVVYRWHNLNISDGASAPGVATGDDKL